MIVNPVSSTPTPANPRVPVKNMNQQDFLKLMMVQLQNQDPLKPQDGATMLTQMSQIASMQSMTSMQQALTNVGVNQQVTLAQSLLNRTVQVKNSDGQSIEGKVDQVDVSNSDVQILVNGQLYKIADLKKVLPDAIVPPPPQ